MISRIINKQNILVAFCNSTQLNSTQLNSTQLNSNLNSFKIFASFFDVLNKLCHCEPNEVKAWQYNFNELLNSVKSNLIFVDCFASRCVPNGKARNYEYNNNYAFSYAFNFEIISRNKNLKSNYYGFLFNKQISLLKGWIEQ